MKRFSSFLKKEFLHIFRDPRTMIILFGIPIVEILLFGKVISNEIKDAGVAVYAPIQDATTRGITGKLEASEYFSLQPAPVAPQDQEASFKQNNLKEIVVFEPHFEQNLIDKKKAQVQILTDASDPNTAQLLASYTGVIISNYMGELNSMGPAPGPTIKVKPRMLYNEDLKAAFMFVPGTMVLVLMLISAMMTSITITREKETGTMEILLASPLRPTQIILGKVTPYLVLSIINALVIIGLGYFLFGLPIRGSFFLLLFECLIFILTALSLGILISTVAQSQMVAMAISLLALFLPTMLLSGFIFPIENMPEPLQWLSLILPPRWFLTILKGIMLKGNGLAILWKETLILVGMTTFYIFLSVKKFKTRLE